jgi:hypothetical protein
MTRIGGATGFRNFGKTRGIRAVDILGRSKDENRLWRHRAQEIQGAFDICAKALFGIGRIFAELGGEMYDDVIGTHPRRVEWAEYVEMGSAREIFSVESSAHVRPEITATACDKNSQKFLVSSF